MGDGLDKGSQSIVNRGRPCKYTCTQPTVEFTFFVDALCKERAFTRARHVSVCINADTSTQRASKHARYTGLPTADIKVITRHGRINGKEADEAAQAERRKKDEGGMVRLACPSIGSKQHARHWALCLCCCRLSRRVTLRTCSTPAIRQKRDL